MFRKRSRCWIIAALVLCTSLATTSWGRANESVTEFNIPPQSLDSALLVFAEQADVQVSVSTVAIAGMKTRGVVGRLTPSVALARLLTDSGLQFSTVGERTYSVSTAGGSKSASGTRLLLGADNESGERGRIMPLAQRPENADSAVVTPATHKSDPTPRQENSEFLGETVVTGSRLRRTGDDGPAPVIVFDLQRINQLGVTNVADVLAYLPQQTFSHNEAFNVGGTRFVRLRGLGLGTTLVLINGRRTVTSAISGAGNVFDLNTIPLASVQRIEILADSASAVYGADAVGGVVNVILKSTIEEPVLELQYGTSDAGGGDERRASISLGISGDRLRSSVVLDYFDRAFLLGENLDRFANKDFRRFGGADFRVPTANPGNICSVSGGNLPGLPTPCAAVPDGSTGVGLTPASFIPTAGQTNLESTGTYGSVVPETERSSAAAFGEFDITSEFVAFGEFLYAKRRGLTLTAPLGLTNVTVPASNPFNPFGEPVRATYLVTGVGPTRFASEGESYRSVAGLRGDWDSWGWEVSALAINEDGVSVAPQLTLDTTFVNAALAATNPSQALNVFQDGPGGSPNLLASLVRPPRVNNFSSDALQGAGFIRGRPLSLPAGSLEVVLGVESRREELHVESRPSLILSADRHTSSAFAELRVPLIDARMDVPMAERLALTVAGRYDKYSDFGESVNPQYGLEWHPVRQLLLRGSYGTSYRAPSLFELFQPATALTGQAQDPRRNNAPSTFAQTSGGNPGVDPEESTSMTAGFLFAPSEAAGLRVGVTYWAIDQDLRIVRPTNTVILANESYFPDRIVRAAPTLADIAAGFPGALVSVDTTTINAGRLKTSGVDIQVSESFGTALGRFQPTLSATWIEKYDAADFPNTALIELVDVANSQGSIPEWRATATLGWALKGYELTTTVRYTASYEDASGSTNIPNGRRVDPPTLVDLQASIDFGEVFAGGSKGFDGLMIRAGVKNALDEEPAFTVNGGSLGYDPSQADTRQRFGYVYLSKAF